MAIKSERQNNFFRICEHCKTSCCRNARPPLTSKRRRIIEEYVKEQRIPIVDPFVQEAYLFPKEDAEGYCIFRDKKTKKCLIHPVKPETCVAGPITFDINKRTQKIEWHLKMEKICPLAGALYKNKEVLRNHLKVAKKEISALVQDLDTGALEAILKIEEPETFKIAEDNIHNDVTEKLNLRRNKKFCRSNSGCQ
jgi:Fe-S-cluster containining protein